MAPGSRGRNPTNWDEYEGRPSPSGSLTSSVLGEEQALLDDAGDDDDDNGSPRRPFARRRPRLLNANTGPRSSSVTNRLAAVADIGGVNSIRSFARSWQRAAGFAEVIPRRPSFVLAFDQPAQDGEDIQYGRGHVDAHGPPPQSSLLRQHFEASPPQHSSHHPGESHGEPSSTGASATRPSAGEADFKDRESKALDAELAANSLYPTESYSSRSSIFAAPPLSSPPIVGSYGSYRSSQYGTIGGGTLRARMPSITGQAPSWSSDVDNIEDDAAHGEHQPILVKEVKQGNKVILTVEGQSTLPQSVFNSINAIIGIGLLSLPLAFKMSGWIFGLGLLTLNAAVTAYTAKLLAKCMDADASLITYSDVAYVCFGAKARIVVSALFSLELIAACVALVILFADSLALLLPGVATVEHWKCACAVLVLALNAMPLRWLSYTSIIGIFATFSIVCIVIADGLIKPDAPGSLREPAQTYLLPTNWLALPLAYGLLASPWGAHSVFPSIYRDMRHPYKWGRAVKITFSFSYVLDICLAVIGILMFGDDISDAITSNILKTPGYPDTLTVLMCLSVAIIPLTKIPLNFRPIITTVDILCGLHQDHHHHQHNSNANRRSVLVNNVLRGVVRVGAVLLLLGISIVFPAFDSVCAFLGAALCSLISIILPILFYLKLFSKDITASEKLVFWVILAVFSVLATLGTIWTFLPKHLIGAD
ncbi:Vacuolar amino acid transporter 1 [Paramyrothecium foliicola]|nr:Vacuolar amino acid transporter 1 [Paramyrothecium foliicola]